MARVNTLVWDEWNRNHLSKHSVTPQGVQEVCRGKHKTKESYRKRILLKGKIKSRKAIINCSFA